jgi:hypothetical protein
MKIPHLKIILLTLVILASFLLVLALLPQPFYKNGFKNLGELQEYATTIDEFIKMDDPNYLFPSYESYYQNRFTPSPYTHLKEKFDWLLYQLHLKSEPLFSPSFFAHTLKTVLSERVKKGWTGNFVQKIDLQLNSKIIVFGVIQGAFHSLVRDLEQLFAMGIIDKNLKIQAPETYIVFLGNVVDRSPYTLEIFSVILRLLATNPDNVIYLKGTHEFPRCWKQHTLRRELELRANKLSTTVIPLEQAVDAFFNTLPLTLYCTLPYTEIEGNSIFKLSAFIDDPKALHLLANFNPDGFLPRAKDNKIETAPLLTRKDDIFITKKATLRAIIRGIKKRESYEKMDGLRLLEPMEGIITWTVLSNPIETHRAMLNFFYDAFVIITPGQSLNDWTITLYNRDLRNVKDKTFKQTPYHFFTGERT